MSISEHDHQTFTGFPMPRDPQALVDRNRRPIVRSPRAEPRFPFPVPNGWFIVAEARDLDPGEMRTFKVFGEDVVLFRRDDGAPHMVDAFCAHLGAHLAVGGRIEEGCIRCPFHGWRYDGDTGQCNEIPYGNMDRIPSQAVVPVHRAQRMIWAWHHGSRATVHDARGPRAVRCRLAPQGSSSSTSRPAARDGREQRRLRPLHVRARLTPSPTTTRHRRAYKRTTSYDGPSSVRAGSGSACCASPTTRPSSRRPPP
jgi:nitrite reductase/ring-hydroxylating ferredoxin subunit